MKEQVGRQAPDARRIDASLQVVEDELPDGRLAVVVEHFERHFHGRLAIKEQVDLVAKAEILRSLADVEQQLGFALAPVAAEHLQNAVFQDQPGKFLVQRLLLVQADFQPAVGQFLFADFGRGVRLAG